MKYNFQEIRHDKTKISLANCQSETVGIEMESDFILTFWKWHFHQIVHEIVSKDNQIKL